MRFPHNREPSQAGREYCSGHESLQRDLIVVILFEGFNYDTFSKLSICGEQESRFEAHAQRGFISGC